MADENHSKLAIGLDALPVLTPAPSCTAISCGVYPPLSIDLMRTWSEPPWRSFVSSAGNTAPLKDCRKILQIYFFREMHSRKLTIKPLNINNIFILKTNGTDIALHMPSSIYPPPSMKAA
ncbi:MAG: hypothetical protein V4634_20050 [Pseudomonadota bacterium]